MPVILDEGRSQDNKSLLAEETPEGRNATSQGGVRVEGLWKKGVKGPVRDGAKGGGDKVLVTVAYKSGRRRNGETGDNDCGVARRGHI